MKPILFTFAFAATLADQELLREVLGRRSDLDLGWREPIERGKRTRRL